MNEDLILARRNIDALAEAVRLLQRQRAEDVARLSAAEGQIVSLIEQVRILQAHAAVARAALHGRGGTA